MQSCLQVAGIRMWTPLEEASPSPHSYSPRVLALFLRIISRINCLEVNLVSGSVEGRNPPKKASLILMKSMDSLDISLETTQSAESDTTRRLWWGQRLWYFPSHCFCFLIEIGSKWCLSLKIRWDSEGNIQTGQPEQRHTNGLVNLVCFLRSMGSFLSSVIINCQQNVNAVFFKSGLFPGVPYHPFLFQRVPLNVLFCIYVCRNVYSWCGRICHTYKSLIAKRRQETA